MKAIKQLVEDISEELKGASHYAKLATKYRDEDRELSDTYAKKSSDELTHVNDFHAHVARLIKSHKATGKEVPPAMQAVWDWEHEKMMDETARVKSLLDMLKR